MGVLYFFTGLRATGIQTFYPLLLDCSDPHWSTSIAGVNLLVAGPGLPGSSNYGIFWAELRAGSIDERADI